MENESVDICSTTGVPNSWSAAQFQASGPWELGCASSGWASICESRVCMCETIPCPLTTIAAGLQSQKGWETLVYWCNFIRQIAQSYLLQFILTYKTENIFVFQWMVRYTWKKNLLNLLINWFYKLFYPPFRRIGHSFIYLFLFYLINLYSRPSCKYDTG